MSTMGLEYSGITGVSCVVERSANSKLGPMSCTYAAKQTCPEDCPMREDCYAYDKFVGGIFERLTLNAEDFAGKTPQDKPSFLYALAKDEAEKIKCLTGKRPLRVHVSGDVRNPGMAAIIGTAMVEHEKGHGDFQQQAWTYTHAWKDIPKEAWCGARVLASVEDFTGVESAMSKGYSSMLVVDGHLSDTEFNRRGVKFIPCRHDVDGTRCVDCLICPAVAEKLGWVVCVKKI